MTRAAIWLLSAGVLLFAGVLVSQGLVAVFATLAVAGWGLPLVALLHLIPLTLDSASVRVMFDTAQARCSLREILVARWLCESANSFLPAGPIGGPVVRPAACCICTDRSAAGIAAWPSERGDPCALFERHLLLDNGVHDSTGGQATFSGNVSFAQVAAACGYASSLETDDPIDVKTRLMQHFGF